MGDKTVAGRVQPVGNFMLLTGTPRFSCMAMDSLSDVHAGGISVTMLSRPWLIGGAFAL